MQVKKVHFNDRQKVYIFLSRLEATFAIDHLVQGGNKIDFTVVWVQLLSISLVGELNSAQVTSSTFQSSIFSNAWVSLLSVPVTIRSRLIVPTVLFLLNEWNACNE